MKNGSQRSSPRSSIPAPRQRTSVPSGRVRDAGLDVSPSLVAVGVDVVVGEADGEPAVAVRGQLQELPPEHGLGSDPHLDDAQQLDVVLPSGAIMLAVPHRG